VVLNLSHETARVFFDEIGREYGFTVAMEHLALFGLCQMCQEIKQVEGKDCKGV
jgi:Fe2+ or Zn2+ uptake regulation protein